MAGKTKTMEQIRNVIQSVADGKSIRWISKTTGISRNTLRLYLKLLNKAGLTVIQALSCSDQTLSSILFEKAPAIVDKRLIAFTERLPHLLEELSRPHVTRQILWKEYRAAFSDGYGYTRFCHLLNTYLSQKQLSAILEHKPGEELMVDFAGDKLCYYDDQTGESIACEVLVLVMPASNYILVEAVPSQKQEHFIGAIVKAFNSLGAVPKVVVCDNLRSAVVRSNRYEPKFTELIEQLSLHYRTAFVATRVRKPKDKASVEGAVKTVYQLVYTAIRNDHPTSLKALNALLQVQLKAVNERKIRDRKYTRAELLEQEKAHMIPLPKHVFEVKKTVMAKAQRNYHVILGEDMHQYSVPYRHAGQSLKIVYTSDTVEIYHQHSRIAVHSRNYKKHGYTTLKEHMPANHAAYFSSKGWNAAQFESKAKVIGAFTHQAMQQILASKYFPEQTYNACLGVLRLADKYGNQRLDLACSLALQSGRVNYGILESILKNNRDKAISNTQHLPISNDNVRGSSYYQ
jgi:transposase